MLPRVLGLILIVFPGLAVSPRTPALARAPQSPFGEVTVTVTPSAYDGACPVRVRFVGKVGIETHPMAFNYHFERSDGAKSPLRVVRVPGANTRAVTVDAEWQLGRAGQHLQVWEKLFVASGNTRIQSNEADADITCR